MFKMFLANYKTLSLIIIRGLDINIQKKISLPWGYGYQATIADVMKT